MTDRTVSTVFVAPTEHCSGLIADDKRTKVYTDSFWVTEPDTEGNSVVKHVKPSRPIPIDSILVIPSKENDPVLKNQETPLEKRFGKVTDDKYQTKQVLAAAGIPMPRGILVKDISDPQFVDQY
ncbi:MAG TPA: hypothetical protein VE090_03865 [Methylomirabilota bacterium]|nr:hypothetical protein [Methylomirabilota bacterium]